MLNHPRPLTTTTFLAAVMIISWLSFRVTINYNYIKNVHTLSSIRVRKYFMFVHSLSFYLLNVHVTLKFGFLPSR